MNPRLQKILTRNAEMERESPYNFCDRWCERCVTEKQIRCRIYHGELEQRLTCVAHGRDDRDPEITEEVMKRQLEEMGSAVEEEIEGMDAAGIDFGEDQDSEAGEAAQTAEAARSHPLVLIAETYRKQARVFLQKEFYPRKNISSQETYDFETLAWYHMLLQVKLCRALTGFLEPDRDDDALCDAIAQFAIAKKAIDESVKALRNIGPRLPACRVRITELLALLQHLDGRIHTLEESV